ncbi:hypothetical protein PIROE2DRAFT_5269 [Piromyces sp. E2]|nr:hypothetical protein PIROE2DRAFT_5269 [Piromyces sp. E2]|eukprot:OUM67305.1 hypothetical protein PIROE2DRAFT_5269 [Piromyces sp. E2]
MKRLFEEIFQLSILRSSNKKRRTFRNDELINNFFCSMFFIDKSLIIKEFIEDISDIICVTRPTHYGKTVNITMMKYIFEMDYENEKNLNISKEKKNNQNYIDLYQGQFPVVYLDFDNITI